MRACLATVLSITFILCLPARLPAADPLPIVYWQLIDEERYLYRSDLEHFNWREIRKIREQNTSAGRATKFFKLHILEPSTDMDAADPLDVDYLLGTVMLVRDPDGEICELPSRSVGRNIASLPGDNNLIGRYLLGARVPLGKRDVDGDGVEESITLCAKHLVVHYKNGGRMGSASVVFFDDARRMPLEIGPVINTAKSKFGGGTQSPHRTYEMMVKYLGRPLPGATVTVITEGSQWKKTFVTDEDGAFEIMPTDDRFFQREWQKYLYTAAHHDQEKNICYVATLPTVVYKNRPEWRSKAMGFTYWSIIGTGISLLMVAGFNRRRKRLDRLALIVFENHKIQKDPP